LYQFGPFRLDPINRVLHREGDIVPLSPAIVETLRVLVEKRGNAVAKEELLSAVWPDTYVEESSLAHNISVLRKALGEGPGEQRFIQTIPKRGYRFVAAVAEVEEMPSTEPSAAGEAPGAQLSVLPQLEPRWASATQVVPDPGSMSLNHFRATCDWDSFYSKGSASTRRHGILARC